MVSARSIGARAGGHPLPEHVAPASAVWTGRTKGAATGLPHLPGYVLFAIAAFVVSWVAWRAAIGAIGTGAALRPWP